MKFRFNKYYFGLAVSLFITEILIAVYLHDSFIRPYGGDFLVVIFIYCMFKAFVNSGLWTSVIGVLVFSYVIEITQYYHLIEQLGWGRSSLARNLLGTTFQWKDILAYTLGMVLVLIVELWMSRLKRTKMGGQND